MIRPFFFVVVFFICSGMSGCSVKNKRIYSTHIVVDRFYGANFFVKEDSIFFVSNLQHFYKQKRRYSTFDIIIMNLKDKSQLVIPGKTSKGPLLPKSICWLHGGKLIAWSGGEEIFIHNIKRKKTKKIPIIFPREIKKNIAPEDRFGISSLSWSEKKNKFQFSAYYSMWEVSIDGTNLKCLSPQNAQICQPTWSPDGEKCIYIFSESFDWIIPNDIIYMARTEDLKNIKKHVQITRKKRCITSFCWFDNNHIVYTTGHIPLFPKPNMFPIPSKYFFLASIDGRKTKKISVGNRKCIIFDVCSDSKKILCGAQINKTDNFRLFLFDMPLLND